MITSEFGSEELFVLKDPRICRLIPLFRSVLDDLHISVIPVIVTRNPLAVSASLSARDGLDLASSQLYWLRHILDSERFTRDLPRLVIRYERLMLNWADEFRFSNESNKISELLLSEGVNSTIAKFLSKDEQHHLFSDEDVQRDMRLLDWVKKVHAVFSGTALVDLRSAEVASTLDYIYSNPLPIIEDAFNREVERTKSILNQSHADALKEALIEAEKLGRAASDAADQKQIAVAEAEHLRRVASEAADQKNVALEELKAARNELQNLYGEMDRMRKTVSWRVTAPLRHLRRFGSIRVPGLDTVDLIVRSQGGASATARKIWRVLSEEGLTGLRARAVALGKNRVALQHRATLAGLANQLKSEAGKNECAFGDYKIERLAQLDSLDARSRYWAKAKPHPIADIGAAQKLFGSIVKCRGRLDIVCTHDDYRRSIGGVQLCVQIEEEISAADGRSYLVLYPYIPTPILSKAVQPSGYMYEVLLDGVHIGVIDASSLIKTLVEAVDDASQVRFIAHSLIGHSPEVTQELLRGLGITNGVFWVHDYFSVCPGYTLLRNDAEFCHGPDPMSAACGTCIYGAERIPHLQRLDSLFGEVDFTVLAPSKAAASLWEKATDLRHSALVVVNHCEIEPSEVSTGISPRLAEAGAIRVAFLGHPVFHKGWFAFTWLVAQCKEQSSDVEFFHFAGAPAASRRSIEFVSTRTSASDRSAMSDALAAKEIDVVVLWSNWPETFSFTFHEALAAGVYVVTGPHSGNIADQLKDSKKGRCFANELELRDWLLRDDTQSALRARRAKRTQSLSLSYSRMSYQVFENPKC